MNAWNQETGPRPEDWHSGSCLRSYTTLLRTPHRMPKATRYAVLYVVSSALAWWPGTLPAQGSPSSAPRAVGLHEALILAREHGPLHRLADAREQTSIGRVRESTQWANPSLEWRRENLGSALQPDIFATAYVPFDITGRRLALRQSATAGTSRAQGEAHRDRLEAEFAVARAWLRAGGAHMALTVIEQQAAALREIAAIDSQRLREGLVSEAVGLRTSLEADRARVAVLQARTESQAALAELTRLLGVPLTPHMLSMPGLPAPPDSLLALTVALRHRPEMRAREAAVRETERRLAAEQRGVIGEVQLQGGTKETSGVMTGQVGIAMPLPFFNRNDGARQRARGELMEARVQLEDARRAIQGEVVVALQRYREMREAQSSAATFLTRGQDIGQIARVSYREGHITLTELLDAERGAADAMQAFIRWTADTWLSRLDLERALGARLDSDGAFDLPLIPTSSPGY